jgi:hypothetical protein
MEMYGKSGLALLAAVYASGYVITAIHDSQYGFFQPNILRPKLIVAGVTFIVALYAPIYLADFGFDFAAAPADFLTNKRTSPPKQELPKLLAFLPSAAGWLTACTYCAYWASLAFVGGDNFDRAINATLYFGALLIIGSALQASYAAFNFANATPVLKRLGYAIFILYACLFTATGIYVYLKCFSPLLGWFVMVATFGRRGARKSFDNNGILQVRWSYLFIFTASALIFFALHLFPKLKAPLGPAPVRILAHFQKESPLASAQLIPATLLEQTDQGYYLLFNGEKKAVFVPVAAIDEIRFQDSEHPPSP